MRLFAMPSSGNSHKVLLLLALLDRQAEVEVIEVERRSPAFDAALRDGALPAAKAPVLWLDAERALPESNAILFYLADGSRFIPEGDYERAKMLGWLFWEQYSHEPTIAVRSSLRTYPDRAAQATPQRMADLLASGHAALGLMERALEDTAWLLGDGEGPSLADIALYPYTRKAGESGGFDMVRFPAVSRWLERIEALPGFDRYTAAYP